VALSPFFCRRHDGRSLPGRSCNALAPERQPRLRRGILTLLSLLPFVGSVRFAAF
jgi:hypothetical protein